MHPNIVKEFNFGDTGSVVKVRDPFFKVNAPKSHRKGEHNYLVLPIIEEFKKSDTKHFDGNVVFLPLVGRYFHEFLESFPRIISLINNNEKFKVVFLSETESIVDDKYFIGMTNITDIGHMKYKYILDFFDFIGIEFECLNVKHGTEFSADYSYVFYRKSECLLNYGWGPVYIKNKIDFKDKEDYIQVEVLYSGDSTVTWVDTAKMMRNFLPKYDVIKNKKIFIGRNENVFKDRSIKNYKYIENYFKSLGYEIIYLENYKMLDQIKIVQESERVVSIAGSSFINALLLNDKARALSIHTSFNINFPFYTTVFDIMGIDQKQVYFGIRDNEIPDGIEILDNIKSSNSFFIKSFLN